MFFCGYSLSLVGSAMVPVALSFAIFARGGGARDVSAVLAAEMVPMVLLILLGGVIADRLPRRQVMVGADMLRCASQTAMAALLLFHHGGLLPIMAMATLLGIGNAFYVPGRNGLMPQIVTPANLQGANALAALAQSAGALAGPVLAGLLVAATSPGWAIAIDAASYAIAASLLLALKLQERPPRLAHTTRLRHELAEGWVEFTRRGWVWVVVLQFSLFFLLLYGPMQVLGALAFAHVPHGAVRWGALLSMFGAGSGIGGLAALRLMPARPIQTALLAFLPMALLPASLATHSPYWLQSLCFLIGGVSLSVFNVLWETTLQRAIPPQALSRVAAYTVFGALCLLPLGYVIAGPMASTFGRDGALWIGAAYGVLSILGLLASSTVRHAPADPP